MEAMLSVMLDGIEAERHWQPEQWEAVIALHIRDIQDWTRKGWLSAEEAETARREVEKPMNGGGG